MKKNSITSRILFICLIVFPIPFLINLYVISSLSFQTKRSNLLSNLKSASNDFNLQLEKTIYLNKLYLTRIADALGFHDDPIIKDPSGNRFLCPILGLSGNLMNLAVISSDGTLIPEHENDSFIQFLENDASFQEDITSYAGSSSIITISPNSNPCSYLLTVDKIEAADENGMSGYLLGFKKLEDLKTDLLPSSEKHPFGILLINDLGIPLLSSDPELKTQRILLDNQQLSDMTVSFVLNEDSQIGYLNNKLPLNRTRTLAFVSKRIFIQEVLKLPLIILCLTLISFIVIFLLLKLLGRRLNNPLNQLSDCMLAFQEGNYDTRFHLQPYGYEINRLGKIFNAALIQLLVSIEKAKHENLLKQKINKEISIIQDIQDQLLLVPVTPEITEPQFKIIYPKDNNSISNNFFDLILLSNKRIAGMLGTFKNQGVSACLYSVSIRSLFFTYALIYDSVPKLIDSMLYKLSELNIKPETFHSCLFDYEPNQKIFTSYSLGSPFSIKQVKEQNIQYLKTQVPVVCPPKSKICISPGEFENNNPLIQNSIQSPNNQIILVINFS